METSPILHKLRIKNILAIGNILVLVFSLSSCKRSPTDRVFDYFVGQSIGRVADTNEKDKQVKPKNRYTDENGNPLPGYH